MISHLLTKIKRSSRVFCLKERLYDFFLVRLLISIFFIVAAKIAIIFNKRTAYVSRLSWCYRLSKINFIEKYAFLMVKELVDDMKRSNRNYLLEEFFEIAGDRRKYSYPQESVKKVELEPMQIFKVKDYNPETEEKGVLFLKFTDMFKDIFLYASPEYIFKNYYVILEPSWFCYFDPDILMFINNLSEVFIECPDPHDFNFISALDSNLIPISLGATHWIDSDLFHPIKGVSRDFDVIYLANWALYKRHFELFKAIKKLKNDGIKLVVLLVGFSWPKEPRKKRDVENEISFYGIEDCVTIEERVPAQRVNELLNRSKISILLSKREGACKAMGESLSAGTPILVYKNHEGGSLGYINDLTGDVYDYSSLGDKIKEMLTSLDKYNPRVWAEKNLFSKKSTEILNKAIKAVALRKSEPWTKDIVEKVNVKGMQFKHKDTNIKNVL